MKYKRLAAGLLSFVMIVGLLPVLPGGMKKVNADGTVRNVVLNMSGITAPSDGWNYNFSGSNLKFARDESVNKTAALKLTEYSAYESNPAKWYPVTSLTLAGSIQSTLSSGVQLSNIFPGDSIGVRVTGSTSETFSQTSVLFYNSSTKEVAAYGRIGDGTIGGVAKTIDIPADISPGNYQMILFLEKFGTGGSVDQAYPVMEYSVTVKSSAELKSVTFDYNTPPIIRVSGGSLQQTNLSGPMEPVVFGLTDTSIYYFPENYDSIGTNDGITVTRNGLYQITVSGTPAKTSTTVKLAAPSIKAIQAAPSVTTGVEKIQGTDQSMEYASSAGATSWTTCSSGSTIVDAGTWYVRYAGTDEKQPSNATEVVVSSSSSVHYVLINLPEGSHITRDAGSGILYQYGLVGEMEPVLLNADSGYYFPDTYKTQSKNGVTLQVMSESQIKISGSPNGANVTFDIVPATRRKTTPAKPSSVDGDIMKITGTTDLMEYADAETPDVWNDCDNGETIVSTPGTKYVRYKETETANASNVQTVVVDEDPDSGNETPAGGYTVTIENPRGSHITIGTESENLYRQIGITGAISDVIYYADAGYYFPSGYKVQSVNGIRVVRNGSTMLTVKGTPTADTVIELEPAIDVNTPLYKATVINGTGTESYIAGTEVEITAAIKSGQTFTGWRVNSGNITLLNATSRTTSFVMPARSVEVEACYTDGTQTNNDGGSKGNDNSGNAAVTPVNSNTNTGSTTAGGSSSTGTTTYVITPLPDTTIAANSKTLDISAKVKWSKGAWKVSWDKVTGADGYDVFACEGQAEPPTGSHAQISGNGSTKASITTIGGRSVDGSKVYSFVVKAYRVVNQTKDYIGTSRVLYAAGDSNKKYTNVKQLKPSKKTVTVKKGKRKKLQTKYKKQKSSKKLLSDSRGKKLVYYSSNTAVATVDAVGRVSGVSKGNCTVYIVAHNGVRTSVKIKVK